MPKVYNKHHGDAPPNAVYCGRGSKYGNSFRIGDKFNGKILDRDAACDLFERKVLPYLNVSALRGNDLVCFCKPLRCHCDAILRKANS